MPRIPTIGKTSTTPITQKVIADPNQFASKGQALSRTANAIGSATEAISTSLAEIDRLDKESDDQVLMFTIERDINEQVSSLARSLDGRDDWNNFEDDVTQGMTEIRHSYLEKIGSNKNVLLAIENDFTAKLSDMSQVAYTAKQKVKTDVTKTLISESGDTLLEDYSQEPDPAQREIIRNDFALKVKNFAANRLLGKEEASKMVSDFNLKAEKTRLSGMIRTNPDLAVKELDAGNFDLPPDVLESQKKLAKKAKEVNDNQIEKQAKEAKTKAHAEQEQSIGTMFAKKDYVTALQMVTESELLSGKEKKTWTTAINTASKTDVFNKDPLVRAKLRYKVNQEAETTRPGDIWGMVGKGIDDIEAQILIDELNENKKSIKKGGTKQSRAADNAYKILGRARSVGLFDSKDFKTNEVEWFRANERLADWLKDNPGEDAALWIEKELEPEIKSNMLVEILKKGAEFILGETVSGLFSGSDKGTGFDEFLKEARLLPENDSYTDEELRDYYNTEYGGK